MENFVWEIISRSEKIKRKRMILRSLTKLYKKQQHRS